MKISEDAKVLISRVFHAGFVFEVAGTKIIMDPLFENPFSVNCYGYPSVKFDLSKIVHEKFAAIFISHYHDDHCSFESLKLLPKETPIFIYCQHSEMKNLLQELGFLCVQLLEINKVVHIGPFCVTPRQALESDVDCLFEIEAQGLHILNVVDSWIDTETIELLGSRSPWDLVLWPFQNFAELQVLTPERASSSGSEIPEEWIFQLRALQARWIVPSSCQFYFGEGSWLNSYFFQHSYQQFFEFVNKFCPQTQVIRLNPSQTLILRKNSLEFGESLDWVIPVGPQDVDYRQFPIIPVPSMSLEAQVLPNCSEEDHLQVRSFVEAGIVRRYSELVEPFQGPDSGIVWQIQLIDSQGSEQNYFYLIRGSRLESLHQIPRAVDWKTSLPLYKLARALREGECLNSIGLRIQDVSGLLKNFDPLQDPLVRCLYEGNFASYQRAQLARITHGKGKNL